MSVRDLVVQSLASLDDWYRILKMRLPFAATTLLPLTARAVNIVMSNDDGWAEINIRAFYDSLTAAGESVVLSAPAENQSGTGSLTGTPTTLTETCEFNSCPVGSPAEGFNASDTRLNYVNSYPATAMSYGISTLAPQVFGGAPDIAVTGFNVGSNLGIQVPFSGTVGAAVEAINAGVPAIAFSGSTGDQIAWNTSPVPSYVAVYADLATNITQTILRSGTPYLPSGVWLNVNFPASTSTSCSSVSDFSFVLSRIWTAVPLLDPNDATTCGSTRLPTESTVTGTLGCYASISVGDTNKLDADAAAQQVILNKLASVLSCLP